MKKIIFSLIAGFAFIQAAQAVPSNLGESLLEYNAIISSSLLQSTIPQDEFIIDIKRKTKNLTATTAIYEVVTFVQTGLQTGMLATHHGCHDSHSGGQSQTNTYRVQLVFSQNPQIGPPIITVVSVEPHSSHSNVFFGVNAASE